MHWGSVIAGVLLLTLSTIICGAGFLRWFRCKLDAERLDLMRKWFGDE
jgi:hypothetical protein